MTVSVPVVGWVRTARRSTRHAMTWRQTTVPWKPHALTWGLDATNARVRRAIQLKTTLERAVNPTSESCTTRATTTRLALTSSMISHALARRDITELTVTTKSTNARQPTLACTARSVVTYQTITSACAHLDGLAGTVKIMSRSVPQHRVRTVPNALIPWTPTSALA